MSQVQRIIIRSGLQADVPALLTAEMGWDYDKKTLRVGDNTNTPPKILTTKALGDYDFSSATSVTFGNIYQSSNATFNGMDLNSLNTSAGILVRSSVAGKFVATRIVSGDDSLLVTDGNGTSGNIDVRVSPSLLALIQSFAGVVAVASPGPPSTSKAGDLWFDTDTDILYVRADNGAGLQWMDITSVGSGGITQTSSNSAPSSPAIGDEWYSRTEEVLYKRTQDSAGAFWMQIN